MFITQRKHYHPLVDSCSNPGLGSIIELECLIVCSSKLEFQVDTPGGEGVVDQKEEE
jgi:hypothetical protein